MAKREVLVPIEREDIPFHDHTITAVKLPDNRIAVVLSWVCEALCVDAQAQTRRIERTPSIADELVMVKVLAKKGGMQDMIALTLRGFPTWILGINPSELKNNNPEETEHIRQMIIAYQVEAVDVLYNHFARKGHPALPAASITIIQAEPTRPVEEPAPGASQAEMATYYESMALWYRWKADQHAQQWRGEVEERQQAIEEEVRSILPQFGLSTEHKETTKNKILRISKLEGLDNPGSIWNELNTTFGVKTYKSIPDEKWEQVSKWLQRRETTAQKKKIQREQQPTLFDQEEQS